MPVFPQLERFYWFDDQLRRNRYPNAAHLAEHFELSNKTAQRTITLMRDRLGAPMEYDSSRKGYRYTRDSFELPFLQAGQEEILAILLARNLLTHSAGGYISRAIGKFSQRLFSATGTVGLTEDRLTEAFSASWHGYAPVQTETFHTAAKALINCRPLEFSYRSPQKDTVTRVPHSCGDEPLIFVTPVVV